MGKKLPIKWDFRDVSSGIKSIREFLLGRKYVFHNRFPPLIAPRSIPPPDIPRGPEYKYSDQYYCNRSALNSVKPPVVAPIAEGRTPKDDKPDEVKCDPKTMDTRSIEFTCPPTPGTVWWFDCHTYYEEVCRPICPPLSSPPDPPPAPPPCPPPTPPCEPTPCASPPPLEKPCPTVKTDPCAEEPPCRLDPCKEEKKVPPPPPPKPCDPCDPKGSSKGNC